MGVLTGKYNAETKFASDYVRSHAPWYIWFKDGKPSPEHLGKMDAVREILTSGGRTLAQGALAWIWGRSERTIPIPGFKNVQQAEENAQAMAFGLLKPEQMDEIDVLLGNRASILLKTEESVFLNQILREFPHSSRHSSGG